MTVRLGAILLALLPGFSDKPAAAQSHFDPEGRDTSPVGRVAEGRAPAQMTTPAQPPMAGGKRISLQLDKSPINDALRLIASQGGLNITIGPEVTGEVSVFLDNVPVESALKSIVIHNGYAYAYEGGIISVSKPLDAGPEKAPPLTSRVFTLRAQDAHRVKLAIEHALSKFGRMTVLDESSSAAYQTTRLTMLGGEADLNANGGGAIQQAQQQGGNRVQNGAGTLGSGMMSRKLIVTDTQERVDLIAGLISELDILPPQVLIEARIVEMTTDLQRQLGIDWNIEALGNGPILNHEWPLQNRAGFASGSQIRRSPDGTPFSSAGLALGSVDFTRFTALLRARQDDNSIRLLANPRLLVYNNHSASILVGERYPILEANITDFGTLTESFDTYIPVGIQLEVTPTILPDGRISMLVHPSTSALGDDVVGTTGIRVARIQVRELDTRIVVRDGMTVVLGGLLSDRKVHAASKVPGLGDWPIFSIFFRQEAPQAARVDLLVFLTARVEGATEMDERDRKIYDMYRPHFKHIERLQDVPLHFEIPTEYAPPRPMFSDPPNVADESTYGEIETAGSSAGANRPAYSGTARPAPATSPPSEEMTPDDDSATPRKRPSSHAPRRAEFEPDEDFEEQESRGSGNGLILGPAVRITRPAPDADGRTSEITVDENGRVEWARPSGGRPARTAPVNRRDTHADQAIVVEQYHESDTDYVPARRGTALDAADLPRGEPRRLLPGDARRLRPDERQAAQERARTSRAARQKAGAVAATEGEDLP